MKETQTRSQALYDKEVRRARKEAFKSSSTVVKLQEELKGARNVLSVTRSDLDLHRVKVGKREQETFEAQYKLVGAQEELEKMRLQMKSVEEERDALAKKVETVEAERDGLGKQLEVVGEQRNTFEQQVKTVEEERVALEQQVKVARADRDALGKQIKILKAERDALKTSLKDEEVARIAAEGKIALPNPKIRDEFTSPRKGQVPSMNRSHESMKEDEDPHDDSEEDEELKATKAELVRETKRRKMANEQIEFMKIECQFMTCSCRRAEKKGKKYVYDASLDEAMEKKREEVALLLKNAREAEARERGNQKQDPPCLPMDLDIPASAPPTTTVATSTFNFSPTTGTFQNVKMEVDLQNENLIDLESPPKTTKDARPVLQQSISAPLPEDLSLMSLLHAPHHPEATAGQSSAPVAPRPLPVVPSRETGAKATGTLRHHPHSSSREASAPSTQGSRHLSRPPSRGLPASSSSSASSARAARQQSRPPSREAHTSSTTAARRPPSRQVRTTTSVPQRQPGHASSRQGSATSTIPALHEQHTKQLRIVSTTTTVPLAGPFTPSTMTREEALEQIRQRRGRAKSVADGSLTPRKQMVEGAAKRDISAPAAVCQKEKK